MKVLQLVTSTQRRGAEVFADQLSEKLRARGHEVTLAAVNADSTDRRGLSPDAVLTARSDGTGPVAVARAAADLATTVGAGIVQANGGSTPKIAAMAAWLNPKRSWKLVYRNIGDVRVWLSTPAKRLFYRLAVWPKLDGVISVSRQAKEGLLEVFGGDGRPVDVIYQGVDEAALRPRTTRPDVRRELMTSDGEIVVVWVGSLSTEKRPDRALRVMSRMKSQAEPVVLWVVGAGPMESELVAVAQDLGVSDRVRWVGAVEDVGTYLHAADIFLLTSDTEGIPGALLEAMAVGLPSVVTDVGGVSEVVGPGRPGFLAAPEDEEGLASFLSQLAEDGSLRRRIGGGARSSAAERFGMDTCVESYEDFYRSLLGESATLQTSE